MANSIYKSDNYLIVETTENIPPFVPLNKQFPQNTTVYNRNTEDGVDKFEIIDTNISSGGAGRSTILVDSINRNEWLDAPTGNPYTITTLTTFLRLNTGL